MREPNESPEQKTRRTELIDKKKQATEPKSALIALYSRMLNTHPREAQRLGRVIADIERWQNT